MKIPTVKIEFYSLPDFIVTEEYYRERNGFFKFCGEHSIKPKDVKKVHHILIGSQDYPTQEWEG